MSLWLNLIPQLHRPGVDDLNMRHHHFQEESAQYYDGTKNFISIIISMFSLVFHQIYLIYLNRRRCLSELISSWPGRNQGDILAALFKEI